MNHNIKNAVAKVLDEKLISCVTSVLYKNIKANKGKISYEAAKILAHPNRVESPHIQSEDDYVEDIDDPVTTATASSFSSSGIQDGNNYNQQSNSSKRSKILMNQKISSLSSDRSTTSSSSSTSGSQKIKQHQHEEEVKLVDHVAKVKSIHDKTPSLRCMLGLESEVDHVAKIKSIHENSPSLREMLGLEEGTAITGTSTGTGGSDGKKNEARVDHRKRVDRRIENCFTSFSISGTQKILTGSDESNDLSVPIQFKTLVSVVMLKHKGTIELDSSGTITGMSFS